MKFPTIAMEEMILAGGFRGGWPRNTYKPRACRWMNTKQPANKSLAEVIERGELLLQALLIHSSRHNEANVVWRSE